MPWCVDISLKNACARWVISSRVRLTTGMQGRHHGRAARFVEMRRMRVTHDASERPYVNAKGRKSGANFFARDFRPLLSETSNFELLTSNLIRFAQPYGRHDAHL